MLLDQSQAPLVCQPGSLNKSDEISIKVNIFEERRRKGKDREGKERKITNLSLHIKASLGSDAFFAVMSNRTIT